MNRRDILKLLAITPAIPLSPQPSTTNALVLVPRAIRADMRVYERENGTKQFSLALLKKPWPSVGTIIRFDYGAMHLTGAVAYIEYEPLHGTDHVLCHVKGNVLAFDAADADWRHLSRP